MVDAALTRQLHQLSRQANATLFMTLLAAFQVLLYRHTGQADFLVGTTIAGRTHQSLERLIGFFVNILPLRADLAGDPPFLDLLARVRQSTLAAYDHQALPFEQIVKQVAVERSLSRPSSIQVTFALQNRPLRAIEFPGLQAGRLEFAVQTSRFDLEFSFDEVGDELEGCCTYNPDLFTDATIKRLLGHFVVLLAGIIANPNQPVSQLPLLTPAEYHQLVYEWNNTAVDFGALQHMQALVEEQVARTPDAIAVVFGQEQLTYAELNAQANGLAHGLIEQGVGPETLVVLYAERNPLFLAAILAIFKAGGAYLPLDPRAPAARIAQILSQSKAPFLLASHEFADGVAEALAAVATPDRPRLLDLAAMQQQIHSRGNPPRRGDATNLAYVIYTSGSTGLPKGAMIEQRSMINHLYAMIADLALTNADAIAQTATQSFDISVWQFLTPLLIGGRVHIFSKEVATDPVLLLTQTEMQKITVLEVVPSLLRLMLDAIAQGVKPTLANLRWLIPTGEALPPNLCRQWFTHYPSIPLLNAYGPTECADDVTLYPLFEPPAEDVRTIPIGYPVANMQVYILDHHLQPVPIGVPGELYIGGIGVGRGYLNDPARTIAAFIEDPFTQSPITRHTPQGPRLYKTGDMARYLPPLVGGTPGLADRQIANIEFLGRQDYQVKIRGFRIELEDIEQALLTHEGVHDAVVLARQDKPGELGVQLVAYFVGDADSATLQQHLAQRLPEYMLPAALVALPAMPLTPHGKIDRRALPAPVYASATRDLVPAETLDEMRLLLVWQRVLGVQPIGVEDNFFELGGHSLLAPQLIYQMRQTLQRDFSLQQLFATPTIRSLLQRVAQPQVPVTSFVPLRSGEPGKCGERAPLFLIHAISGLVFPFTALLPYLAATQPVYALQARGIYDELAPFSSLDALAAATIQEMKTIQPHGPYAIAGWSFGGLVAFEIARQLASAGETIAFLGIIDAYPGLSAQAMTQALATPQAQLHAFVDLLLNAIGGDQPSLPEELFCKALAQAEPVEWLLVQINQQRPWLALDPAIMKRIWRTLKHNGQLLQAYQPRPFPGMITLFSAEASAPVDGLRRWQALTPHPVQRIWVNGEHNTMLNPPQVEKLGRELEKRLQGVMADVDQVIARG